MSRETYLATDEKRPNYLLAPVVALLLCTPKFLAGAMTLGEIVQAAAAFGMLQGAFNWITDSYWRLAEWAASANRVASLLLALDQIDQPEPSPNLGMAVGMEEFELTDRAGAAAPDSDYAFRGACEFSVPTPEVSTETRS